MIQQQVKKILSVLELAERLKYEMRHCWYLNGRQESVAEHTWRLCFMIVLISPYINQKVNLEKCLKMAIIHDLAEAEVGDEPVFEIINFEEKHQIEKRVMARIKDSLGDEIGQEIYRLWCEFEDGETYEAKFVTALDKLEASLQHINSPIETWTHKEKLMVFQDKWKELCEFDSNMEFLNKVLVKNAIEKLIEANEDIKQLEKEALATT